jgi:hypothetical protein
MHLVLTELPVLREGCLSLSPLTDVTLEFCSLLKFTGLDEVKPEVESGEV